MRLPLGEIIRFSYRDLQSKDFRLLDFELDLAAFFCFGFLES
jgi:hypothetical protein